jgi:two-component system, NarL family, response regulator DevR
MAEPEEGVLGVLVVDDHQMFAESLARLLSDQGDIVVLGMAAEGSEALDLCERLKPDVILIDYHMPGRDGVSIAAEIKRNHPEIMVIMLTGSAEDHVVLAAIEAGCSGYVTKDRAATELVDAVRSAAAGEVVISPALLARLLPQLNRTSAASGVQLTERELQLLGLMAKGSTNKVIADELNLSVNTVRNYVQILLTKLNVHSKLEAVSTAVREGIIDYPSGP